VNRVRILIFNSSHMQQKRYVCRTWANLNVDETFRCPSCRTRLTSSDRRRSFFCWGVTVLASIVWLATAELFPISCLTITTGTRFRYFC
jgi:uncharacterized paraquat-inducible protein A